jgi:chromosome segregation ATPase
MAVVFLKAKEIRMRGVNSMGVTAVVLMALVMAGAAGCSSGEGKSSSGGSTEQGKKAVESFTKTKEALAKGQKQVDAVIASINQLSSGKDLAGANKKFNSSVADLKKSGEAARKRYEEMSKKQAAFVEKWQKEMSKLTDPNLKSTLEQRRAAVSANFDKVKAAAAGVKDAYQPFMAQLGEVQKTLAVDLTPQTVAGIKPTLDKAVASGQNLKQKIAALQGELNAIESGLSSAVPKGSK